MAKVKFKRVLTNSDVDNLDFDDGSFIVTAEGKTYIDYGDSRIAIGGTPDTEMSDISTNTVENNVIKEYVDDNFQSSGKILWTNPNPTVDFPQQDITLSSSDYDILDFYFKSSKGNNYMLHNRTLKGYSAILFSVSVAQSPYVQRRYADYVNDTTYNIKGMEGAWGGDEGNLLPMYVIGYKTGLFD